MSDIVPRSDEFTSLQNAKRGEEIIEYVAVGLSLATGGLSEAVAAPLRRLIKKRLEAMEEALVTDIRNGLISADDVIEEERLASFILRVRRGAIEGVGRRKIRLMARIFFKDAAKDTFEEDAVTDFWLVTEQLNMDDIKVLAILKRAQNEGYFDTPATADKANGAMARNLLHELDKDNFFAESKAFEQAASSLWRFGFVEGVSAWGGLIYQATERCLRYLQHIDLETLEISASAQGGQARSQSDK